MAMQQERIDWRYLRYIFGLCFRQYIQNFSMALYGTVPPGNSNEVRIEHLQNVCWVSIPILHGFLKGGVWLLSRNKTIGSWDIDGWTNHIDAISVIEKTWFWIHPNIVGWYPYSAISHNAFNDCDVPLVVPSCREPRHFALGRSCFKGWRIFAAQQRAGYNR